MEVTLADVSGFPRYPFYKVVLAEGRAEVADFPADSAGTENFFIHCELEERLREKHPDLSKDAKFVAGWLSQRGEEAALHLYVLASGFTADDCERIGRALSDWCEAAGVRKLMIADASERSRRTGDGAANWSVPDPDNWELW